MKLWNNHSKNTSFQNQIMGGDNRVKMVHRNLLLLLLSVPLDHAGEPDNGRSVVNPKETMGTKVAVAVSAVASHVHNLSAYEGAQVTNMFKRGLQFVTALFWKC